MDKIFGREQRVTKLGEMQEYQGRRIVVRLHKHMINRSYLLRNQMP